MLTREQVIEIVGQIDDWKITQILPMNTSVEELLEAYAGIIEQGNLEVETVRRLSATVARLYDIIAAGEPRWPERDETR